MCVACGGNGMNNILCLTIEKHIRNSMDRRRVQWPSGENNRISKSNECKTIECEGKRTCVHKRFAQETNLRSVGTCQANAMGRRPLARIDYAKKNKWIFRFQNLKWTQLRLDRLLCSQHEGENFRCAACGHKSTVFGISLTASRTTKEDAVNL